MSKAKGFLIRGLLHAISFLGFVISLLLAPIVILIGPVRELMFTISLLNAIWEKDFLDMIKGSFFFFYLQIAIGVPGIAVTYLGIEHLFDGIVAAGLIIVFVALQLPRMLPPYFGAVFATLDEYDKKYHVSVKSSDEATLHFHITNLGLTFYKNCSCLFKFEEGFKVIKVVGDYPYKVQNQSRDALFLPDKIYLSVSPCNTIIFSVQVKTPAKSGDYKIRILLDCENTWGTSKQSLKVKVTD